MKDICNAIIILTLAIGTGGLIALNISFNDPGLKVFLGLFIVATIAQFILMVKGGKK